LRVSRDAAAHAMRLIDDRLDLVGPVSRLSGIALRRIDSPGDRHFDEVGAQADVLPDHPHTVVDAVHFLAQRRHVGGQVTFFTRPFATARDRR
jgi:hypothetical protein